MCYSANPSGEVTSIVDKPEDGDVILQIGKVSFESYNLEGTSPKLPFILWEDEIDYEPWVLLTKIVHQVTDVQAEDITLSTLKKVAAYAKRYQYAADNQIGNVAEDAKWLEARLQDFLPEDNAHFPVNRSESYPDDTAERVFDILCIAHIFKFRNLLVRASRQLMWCVRPNEMANWLFFDLGSAIRTKPPTNFFREFGIVNEGFRLTLMSKLPQVFYPGLHGEIDGPGGCIKCLSETHDVRWYKALTEHSEVWKSELLKPSFPGNVYPVHLALAAAFTPPSVECLPT
ncbi:hypothetical protein H2200_004850 [Cladophialophora chaetospira]|uniref:Uncharacterized protein n=1 Tax=Cladophialophora chaetospira TaxID=386627 RepID=A0AA38XDV8_9EURO|nr:hypothetical protein H2200_004850 [Cladophialophora chaetospira]